MMLERWFDTAEICATGHVINPGIMAYPEISAHFCPVCGAPMLRSCPSCETPIPGEYHFSRELVAGDYSPPAYCQECGAVYPWTAARILAACALADEMQALTPTEREMLKESVLDLTRNTPGSALATIRLKKLLAKVGSSAADAFRHILTDVLTEAVRRAIWGTP